MTERNEIEMEFVQTPDWQIKSLAHLKQCEWSMIELKRRE